MGQSDVLLSMRIGGRSKGRMGMMYIQKTKRKKKAGTGQSVGSQDDLLFTASPLLSEFSFPLNVFVEEVGVGT